MVAKVMLRESDYDSDIRSLRSVFSGRTTQPQEVQLYSGNSDRPLSLYIRGSDFYVVAVGVGTGVYHFSDHAPVGGSRNFGFTGSYSTLLLGAPDRILFNSGTLRSAVDILSQHRQGIKGADYGVGLKEMLVLSIFAVSEAIRFRPLEYLVKSCLAHHTVELNLRDYIGPGGMVQKWSEYSWREDVDQLGIGMQALPNDRKNG